MYNKMKYSIRVDKEMSSVNNKLRMIFAAAAVILLASEIYIGIYVRDDFVRPYLGDTLVVILIYCLARIVIPRKYSRFCLLSGMIFVFAVVVELSQIIPLCDLLGIENRLIRTLMGTSFAFGDLIAYLVGNIMTGAADIFLWFGIKEERE